MRASVPGRGHLLRGRPASNLEPYQADNTRFFAEPLPGRDTPLGSPGGAGKTGVVGADTELVASHPRLDSVGKG